MFGGPQSLLLRRFWAHVLVTYALVEELKSYMDPSGGCKWPVAKSVNVKMRRFLSRQNEFYRVILAFRTNFQGLILCSTCLKQICVIDVPIGQITRNQTFNLATKRICLFCFLPFRVLKQFSLSGVFR